MKTPYQIQLEHLLQLAQDPAFVDHAWWRIDQLEACESGLWVGIRHEFEQLMAARGQVRRAKKPKRGPR